MFLYDFVKKNHITKRIFITYFTGFAVIFYFLFCTLTGPKGLIEYFSLKNEIAGREALKKELSSKAKSQQNKVDGMSLNSLDIDLVDEQARKVLGYSGKNEVVIYQEKDSSTNTQ
jgi:cell division protein FtsB